MNRDKTLDALSEAIAAVFIDRAPELAGSIRKLRDEGASKSDIVAMVTRKTQHSPFMRGGLLTMIDELWAETNMTS